MKIIADTALEQFQAYLYEAEKSANTIEKYLRDVSFFRRWLAGRFLDKPVVIEYKQALCKQYAPASVNSMLSSLNAFFVFMNWHAFKVKTLRIQKQIFADQEKELTKAEYNRLLTAAQARKNQRLYYLMQTIGSTGIRVSELQYITCEAVLTGRAAIRCKGKLRQVFLPRQLCGMLRAYAKRQKIHSGPIFISKNGQPLDRSNIWKMLKQICEAAHVSKEKVFPHNFRHLFARTFYAVQKDIVRLADILGHTNVNTTRIYTIETGTIHVRQLQKLGLLRC